MVNLLMGMAMGLSVLSAAVFWVHFQWTHDRQILERSHGQQETRALMDTLVQDIRRANFHSIAITPTSPRPSLSDSVLWNPRRLLCHASTNFIQH